MTLAPTPSIRQLRKRADPNVVILPTAQPTMVKQKYNRDFREARAKLREASPWPDGHYVSPQMRAARKQAAILSEVKTSPEHFVLLMILDAMPREQRQAMVEQLAPRAIFGGPALTALEIIRSTMLNLGQQLDLMRAQDELREGGA